MIFAYNKMFFWDFLVMGKKSDEISCPLNFLHDKRSVLIDTKLPVEDKILFKNSYLVNKN